MPYLSHSAAKIETSNRSIEVTHRRGPNMRRAILLMLILVTLPLSSVEARSVHSTEDIDLFPQGDMNDPSVWEFKRHLAFTNENAAEDGEYVHGMVADGHMTMGISLPHHLETQTVWASTTSTDSNATLGPPDGAYTWSLGPDITVGGFDVSSYSTNTIVSVELVIHFEVPDPLLQDKVRFSVINNGIHDLVKTWGNTQNGLYYMSNGWSIEIFDDGGWTWDELGNIEANLDYVSVGGTDDSQLNADAVGLKITMQTPWYGAERVVAKSTVEIEHIPIIDLDLSSGTLDSVSIAPCGLDSDGGTWTTDTMEKPAGQLWGRVHVSHSDENGSVGIEFLSSDGEWTSMNEGMIPSVTGDLTLRFNITDTCLTSAKIDINDPSLSITGNISGDVTAMNSAATRWTIVVNGETIANNNGTQIGPFDRVIPIGYLLDSDDTELEITIKSWYNWGHDGSPANVSLRINEIVIDGAYHIEYDEDPQCNFIGSHTLQEDGGGLILPLLEGCTDDRTDSDELGVTFQNSNPNIVEVNLQEGQVVIRLIPEASGVAQITTTVTDSAGNQWQEIFTITVENVDDEPILSDFLGVWPVSLGETLVINFSVSDVDSFGDDLVVTTDKSWATVNMAERQIIIDAPSPGPTSVLISACDQSNCVERELDLEVTARPDLEIYSITTDPSEVRAGDIVGVEVFVRNTGQVDAYEISVRCSMSGSSFGGIQMIQKLEPGSSNSVTCDMRAPDDGSVIINATVDNGNTIEEQNENNNDFEILLPIGKALEETVVEDTSSSISSNMIYFGSAGILLIILVLFGLFAPAKIKKIE